MHTRRRTTLAVAALLTSVSCGGGDDSNDARAEEPAATAAGSDAVVTIETFNFQPDPITVAAGTTITFENRDKINHSVTAGTRAAPTPDVFDHTLEQAGDTHELTLDEPGTYAYFCSFHPGEGMTGEIVVD